MKRLPRHAIVAAVGSFGFAAWFLTRPVIVVAEKSPLWASEYDASREGTTHPGPGVPKEQLRAGERLKVVWDTYGKDYLAFCVVRENWHVGWVLYGQPGIAPVHKSEMKSTSRRGEKRPNQSPEPMVMSVTPRADARVAPATTMAHL
jgi:hypothetical protein